MKWILNKTDKWYWFILLNIIQFGVPCLIFWFFINTYNISIWKKLEFTTSFGGVVGMLAAVFWILIADYYSRKADRISKRMRMR